MDLGLDYSDLIGGRGVFMSFGPGLQETVVFIL